MKIIFFITLAIFLISLSCGSPQETKDDSKKPQKEEKAKKEKQELDVETYCKISNELRALLMEKYWQKFKGKTYEEAKDIYANYLEEEDAIFKKYGIENKLDLSSYFRIHFKEVEEFQANNPEHKDYEEYNDAKLKLISFASAKSME